MSEEAHFGDVKESSAETCTAADAIRRAKAELEKARDCYERLCREARERAKAVRDTSIGDVLDGTLTTVKRHPGLSLALATLIGFFLGRMFRR